MIATTITATIVAAVVAAVATLLLSTPTAAPSAGSAAASPAASPPAAVPPASTPSADLQQTAEAAPPPATADEKTSELKIATSSARLDDVRSEQEPTPVGLQVDTIGVEGAPIDPVGIEADGSMEIPVDISRIGWYEYGPSPGQDQGSAVLTAHIDSRTQGKGVFYHLDAMSAGDTVNVEMSDGTTRGFVVDDIQQIPKVDLPTGELFRRDGAGRLALITCGGEFDSSSRHYRDNIVVFASPAG